MKSEELPGEKKLIKIAEKAQAVIDGRAEIKKIRIASNALFKSGDAVIRISPEDQGENYLREQLILGDFLTKQGFKTSAPLSLEIKNIDGFLVTFWEYLKGEGNGINVTDKKLGIALKNFHQLTDNYTGNLPEWTPAEGAGLRSIERISNNEYLKDHEVNMIYDRFQEFQENVPKTKNDWGIIHGDFGVENVIALQGEPFLIDFDRVCFGPREWDTAHPLFGEMFFGRRPASLFYKSYGVVVNQRMKSFAYLKAFFATAWLSSQKPSDWKKFETEKRLKFFKDPGSNWEYWSGPPKDPELS